MSHVDVSRETLPRTTGDEHVAGAALADRRGARLARQTLDVDGVPISFRAVGQGEPVILVHGLAGSIHWWHHNVAALAAEHRVYLIDLPGFGSMRHLRSRWALARAAEWLARWMDAAGLASADLIGHSMGGLICLELAATRPTAVRRLVLAAPALLPDTRSLLGEVVPLLRALRYVRPSFVPLLAYDTLRAGPVTLLRASREILAADAGERLSHVAAPTLLIWGEHDTLVPPSAGAMMRARMPDARLLLLDHAGHVVMFDRPAAFNAAVTAFLSEG